MALALVLPLAACGEGGEGRPRTITVLAAASLTDVFRELGADFEARYDDGPGPGAEVRFSFGSSTDLAEQAADGAPGDVLATADPTAMAIADDAGVVEDAAPFATNVLVIVAPSDNPADVTSLDDLEGTTWVRCADDVPCGRVALAVLADAGVDAEPASLEEDVRSTLDKVASSEADAGLVYASDALTRSSEVTTIPIAGAADHLTTYVIAALEQSVDDDLAEAWVDFVTGPEGQAALTDAGFTLP